MRHCHVTVATPRRPRRRRTAWAVVVTAAVAALAAGPAPQGAVLADGGPQPGPCQRNC